MALTKKKTVLETIRFNTITPTYKPAIKAAIVLVGKTLAERLLELNTNNRTIKHPIVMEYTDKMVSGEWVMNGEPIIFSLDGVLINGQHRLLAIIASDTSQHLMIIKGVNRDTFKTMDCGKNRGAGEVVFIEHRGTGMTAPEAGHLASLVKLELHLRHGHTATSLWDSERAKTNEILNFINSDKEKLLKTVIAIRSIRLTGTEVVPKTTAMLFLYRSNDWNKTFEFFKTLYSGKSEFYPSAAIVTRNKLINTTLNAGAKRVMTLEKASITAKGLTWFLEGHHSHTTFRKIENSLLNILGAWENV